VNLINNTIASNDATATAGPLANTIGAPLASAPTPTNQCSNGSITTTCTASAPQPAGVVTMANSSNLTAAYPAGGLTCPPTHAGCAGYSNPYMANDLIWQNRSYYLAVGALSNAYQQNILALYNAVTGTPVAGQPSADATTASGNGVIITGGTGACVPGSTYWDLGYRGDTAPGQHAVTGDAIIPTYSLLTNATLEAPTGLNNLNASPNFISQYCNGSRVPPEFAKGTFNVPPGISDATVPNPIFTLAPAATVDEGNNWVNMTWGPLAMANPVTGATLGNYGLAAGSPAIDYIPTTGGTYNTTLYPTLKTDFFGHARPDVDVTNAIDIGAVEYQVTSSLTSINPNTGSPNETVPVTLTGTYLASASAITVSGTGVTCTITGTSTATTVKANCTIAAGTSTTLPGAARTVTVTTNTGATNPVTFTVVALPAPTLTSIAPTGRNEGSGNYPVTLTGTNFTTTGMSAAFFPTVTNASLSAVSVTSSTTLTATLNLPSGITVGYYPIRVTNAAGSSNTVSFTEAGAAAISPNAGAPGTNFPVTITGAGFSGTPTSTVSVHGAGGTGTIAVSNVVVVNDTTITATFTIATGATGSRTIQVTTPYAGTAPSVPFTIQALPTLSSITPTSGVASTTGNVVVPVTLTGTNLTGATSINLTGTGVTVGALTVNGAGTQITANFTIAANASPSSHTVSVTTPVGTTTGTAVTFSVLGPATLTQIAPNTGGVGSTVPVTLTGTGLATATSVNVTAPANGVTVSGFTAVNSTTVTATLTIANSATVGARTITVTAGGGNSNGVTFTVQPPTLTSIAPISGARGTIGTIPVTLTGTNLNGATAVTVSGTGITVSGFAAVNSTTVTANLTISATATLGARNVSVTTPTGSIGPVTFTVVNPATATLTSIAPTGTNFGSGGVAVTLTGTNFTTGTTVSINPSVTGASITGVTVVNSTTITARINTSNTAPQTPVGYIDVAVTNASGTASNSLPFANAGIISISPANGTHGTSVSVTINGAGFTGTNLATGIGVHGTGGTGTITVSGATLVSDSTITATFTIASGATGTRTITVTTPFGLSNSVTFTIN